MPFQAPELIIDKDANTIHINSFNLKNHLPSPHITFHPGQTYRVEIASKDYAGRWEEVTKYIHFYEDKDRHIVNTTIDYNVYGKDILIYGSTITKPIEVVAKNNIRLKMHSSLKAGHYYLNPNLNCNDFKSYARKSAKKINSVSDVNYQNNLGNDVIPPNDIELPNLPTTISLYPNPAQSELNIILSKAGVQNLYIYNQLGELVREVKFPSDSDAMEYKINIQSLIDGMYFCRLIYKDEVISKNFIIKK